jgi:peptide/nickel transport system permease protein
MMKKNMSATAGGMVEKNKPQRSGGKVFQRFLKNRLSILGAVIVLFAFAGGILAPLFSPYDPNVINTQRRLSPPGTAGHFLGTDEFGRDLVSRLLWGARITLFVSITATLMALVAGTLLGLLSGFFMGWFDILVMRLIDILMAFPYFLLAITVIAALGPGLLNGMIAIAIVNIPFFTRIVRGVVLSIKELTYVEAARALGANRYRIIGQHVLINCFSSIVVAGTLNIGWMITAAAGLSFLGLGVQPPTADWGTMIASGRQYISVAPHVATLPGFAIFFTVLGFNLVGDGLRDALDPRLKL